MAASPKPMDEIAAFLAEDASDGRPPQRSLLKTIPMLGYPLGEEAQNLYWKHGQMLRGALLLTEVNIEAVVSLALAEDGLQKALLSGRSTRHLLERRQAAINALKKIYASHAISSPSAEGNAYDCFGFAQRARQRRHGGNRG